MKKGNALDLISQIREKANRFIVRELERNGVKGIVPSHGVILAALYQGERYTMKELADRVHRTKPTVTVLVDKLVDYGFVEKEKSGEDARVTYVVLTQKGKELRPVFRDISDKLKDLLYGGFTEERAEVFEESLHRVNSRLDRMT